MEWVGDKEVESKDGLSPHQRAGIIKGSKKVDGDALDIYTTFGFSIFPADGAIETWMSRRSRGEREGWEGCRGGVAGRSKGHR